MRQWSNPERTFRFSLAKVNFDCEPDAYPGILILTDPSYKEATLLEVKDPRNGIRGQTLGKPQGLTLITMLYG